MGWTKDKIKDFLWENNGKEVRKSCLPLKIAKWQA
jgi:hypothetical protein